MKKFISKEMEVMEMEERIHVIREDLTGDALLSAKLVKAARENNWQEVEKLLTDGADPRICRSGDAFGVESALYYALKAKRFDVAEKLYEAGDRLDDLIVEDEENIPSAALEFLNFAMRHGDNYFYDESKTLSECCRCSNFAQIEKLMPTADKKELGKAFYNTVFAWIRHFSQSKLYCLILSDLLSSGATLSQEEKTELLEAIDRRFNKCPKVMHPGKEAVEQVIKLVKKA